MVFGEQQADVALMLPPVDRRQRRQEVHRRIGQTLVKYVFVRTMCDVAVVWSSPTHKGD